MTATVCRVYRSTNTLRAARAILTVLSTITIAAMTFRFWRASHLGLADLATSLASAALVIGTMGIGWAIHVRDLRDRTRRAEWDAALARRAQRERDEEERSWWADPIDADTVAFGPNVRMFPAPRQARAQAG